MVVGVLTLTRALTLALAHTAYSSAQLFFSRRARRPGATCCATLPPERFV